MSSPNCTATHPADLSCQFSLQSDQILHFNFHGYHGKRGHFENVKPKMLKHPKDRSCEASL